MEVTVRPACVDLLGVGLAGERMVIGLRDRFGPLVNGYTWSTHIAEHGASQAVHASLESSDLVVLVVDSTANTSMLAACVDTVRGSHRSRGVNVLLIGRSLDAPTARANARLLRPAASMLTLTDDADYLPAMLQALGVS